MRSFPKHVATVNHQFTANAGDVNPLTFSVSDLQSWLFRNRQDRDHVDVFMGGSSHGANLHIA